MRWKSLGTRWPRVRAATAVRRRPPALKPRSGCWPGIASAGFLAVAISVKTEPPGRRLPESTRAASTSGCRRFHGREVKTGPSGRLRLLAKLHSISGATTPRIRALLVSCGACRQQSARPFAGGWWRGPRGLCGEVAAASGGVKVRRLGQLPQCLRAMTQRDAGRCRTPATERRIALAGRLVRRTTASAGFPKSRVAVPETGTASRKALQAGSRECGSRCPGAITVTVD